MTSLSSATRATPKETGHAPAQGRLQRTGTGGLHPQAQRPQGLFHACLPGPRPWPYRNRANPHPHAGPDPAAQRRAAATTTGLVQAGRGRQQVGLTSTWAERREKDAARPRGREEGAGPVPRHLSAGEKRCRATAALSNESYNHGNDK